MGRRAHRANFRKFMLVLVSQSRRFDVDTPLQLCEPCARKQATRLKARWPEPHEHSATTKQPGHGWATTIRVRPDLSGDCDHCHDPERDLSGVEIETVLNETFERLARRS